MTTTKASSKLLAGGAGMGPATNEKAAPAQGDKPPKAVRRLIPKPVRQTILGNAESPATLPPPVILWDDPVDPATGDKLKR